MADYRTALEGSSRYLCFKCQSMLTELWANRYKDHISLFTSVGLVLENSARCSLCRLAAHCLGLEKFEIPSAVLQNIDLPDATIALNFLLPPRIPHSSLMRPFSISFELAISSNSIYYNRHSPSYIKIRSDDLGRLGVSEDFGACPPTPTQTQIPLIKKWLTHCSEDHGPFCDTSSFPPSQSRPLMVIDLKDGCLTDLPPLTTRRYFALSYVWGQAATFQTLIGNVDGLRQRGGINAVRHLLPRTITDAMDLLTALNERYLWCDRLCIIQDDAENKHALIARMDEVYATAFAVILARSGPNAEAGLFAERHPWHTEERISDSLRLVAVPDPGREDEYDLAPLERRGWTFQEKLLARRKLNFSHGLATFECPQAKFSAAISSERPIPDVPLHSESGSVEKGPPLDGSRARAVRIMIALCANTRAEP
ncbi:heterokaryon incompatibility protein-domain-containing protein [Sordaria brevicollis]|uniref:Heterokaryon incompatibility protein-domain-containing protein n=1 Tax=Sordaria brevicollis TaxID=83679 RepID=A0AAE0UEC6_SORBR|nr:heterokaryon incompatibility protein-domain-containing protein [Sordaria brevicollis]